MKVNSKFFAVLSLVVTVLALIYFILFVNVDYKDVYSDKINTLSTQKPIAHYPKDLNNPPYPKDINPSLKSKRYEEVFKEDNVHKDMVRNIEEEKNIKNIELKAQQLIEETEKFLIKNNLSIPPNKMTPEQQKQFEIKTQELEKKLEKLQNNIQGI